MAVSKIDWQFWYAMPWVNVWQAVALSLEIDPHKLKAYQDGPPAQDSTLWKDPVLFRNPRIYAEFDKRCQLLAANVSDRRHFTPGPLNLNHSSRHGVKLVEVAAWMMSIGREPVAAGLLEALAALDASALESHDAIPGPVAPIAPNPSLQAWQEDKIRRTARALGYDPLALPPDVPKKQFYVKAIIRERCGQIDPTKMRSTIFNKTWERMMSGDPKQLKYSE